MSESEPHHGAGTADDSERSLEARLQDPLFRESYEDLRARDDLVDFLIGLRKQQGWTQTELAQRLQTTQSAVSDFEKRRIQPRVATLQRWARVFGYRLELQLWQGPFMAYNSWVERSLMYESIVAAVRVDEDIARGWGPEPAQSAASPAALSAGVAVHLGSDVQKAFSAVASTESPYLQSLTTQLAADAS